LSEDDPQKGLHEELAERLATPDGLRTARLLQAAGLLGAVVAEAAAPLLSSPRSQPPPPRGEGPSGSPSVLRRAVPISVWEPRRMPGDPDGELAFVRPEPGPLGDHFASTKILRPKKSELPLRVGFFGESVAAGYLYAPHLTPARVLEEQLRSFSADFEVVDLARTNETIPSLLATVRAALQIQPDVLVLFAGNNWNLLETPEVSPYAPSVRARQRFAQALRQEGLPGPVKRAAEQLRGTVREGFDYLAMLARAVGIPVVVVIPEVNLADWENRQPVPWLPAGDTARWYGLFQKATEALEREAWGQALAAAREMRALDGGACPTTHRILARTFLGLGNAEEARRAALEEVDATTYPTLAFLSAPQATTAVRELLREEARRHGFLAVDLREVFARHAGSVLPGRRLFLDYCHLTAEGMRVAMAAVTAEVLKVSGMAEDEPDWQGVLERSPEPRVSPEADATAKLGAALHSAHRLLTVGPKGPILEHWLERALDASPGVEAAMLDLIEARCAPCPAVLTAAQQRNLASPYRLQLQHGWQWEGLDADMTEAIAAVLERRGRGSIREEIRRLLLEHHAIQEGGTELAVPALYHWDPLERFYPEAMSFEDLSRRATYRSPWPESSFCLICDTSRDVLLELTARLPAVGGTWGARQGALEARVGGTAIGRTELTSRWTRWEVKVNREHLRPGLNRLTLAWPALPPVGDAARRDAVERLEIGVAADLHPVFGEVFSLVARPA
jgi:hypothetical protein